MKLMENKIYFIYILLGLLYFISKVIFYICDFVYFRGVILGLIATVLTICAGMFAFRKYKEKTKSTAHWLVVLIPLIILPFTPLIMIYNLGQGMFQMEKIAILIIFEIVAIIQVILGILMLKNLKLRKINNDK